MNIIKATYTKNRITTLRAYPYTFMIGRITVGLSYIIFPYFIYKYLYQNTLSSDFIGYANTDDYITYVTLGTGLHILGMSTLMNLGRAFITELREGTVEPMLISPAKKIYYFIGCFNSYRSNLGWLFKCNIFIF